MPVNLIPATMVLPMCRVFTDDGNGNARQLCFEIVQKVEESGLLKGYSSTVIAAACTYFAAFAVQRPSFLAPKADGELLKSTGALRTAYNEL